MAFLLPEQIPDNPRGVRDKDTQRLRRQYGGNAFTRKERKTFFRQYLSAFGDPIIKILLIALALNIVIAIRNANIYEPLGIAIALLSATLISTLSEYGSESAFLKLERDAAAAECRVMRDGRLRVLPVEQLVVSDRVFLSAGERVPADGVIVRGQVMAEQSALNGESAEVEKCISPRARVWSLSEKGQLFRGSVITSGECVLAVGRVGDDTFYGGIAAEIQSGGVKSPLTQKLTQLAGVLSKIGFGAAALVFFADLFNALLMDNGFDIARIRACVCSAQLPVILLHAATLAITVMVVAVPEGLPMMITVVLSSNMRRLKRDHVLVRRLAGIEASGGLNILFCDKTGTLTGGKLTVSGFYDPDGKGHATIPPARREDMIRCCQPGNESVMIGRRAVGGNATDRALLRYCYHPAFDNLPVTDRIPFDSTKKYAAVKVNGVWYLKGAPERIFAVSHVSPALQRRWRELTDAGARVIALAKGRDLQAPEMIGVIAISDKVRRDARRSVKTVQDAGISVCMVTGDNMRTARAVAEQCGLLTKDAVLLDSEGLNALTDGELTALLPRLKVVARALPADKSRLVRVSQAAGLICGMTGDGINDAPALKRADVGFGMGSGTEVAKQASDIVILDDNFTSISRAILYGRTIFKSIRKFIVFQLTMNLCAVGISVIGPFLGVDTPITVMQMLWVNMIMDTLAGLAYAGEPPLLRYMRERPVPRGERVLSRSMAVQILEMGIYSLALCVIFLTSEYWKERYGFYTDNVQFMTAFFALFIFCGIIAGLCARTDRIRLFAGIARNRAFSGIFLLITAVQLWLIYYGGRVFRTAGIPPRKLPAVLLLAATVALADTVRKILFKALRR